MTMPATDPRDAEPSVGPPPALGPADLFALAPAPLLEAARDYVLLGRVRRPRRRGCRLAAEVEGSEDVYLCRADLTPGDGAVQILPACACPSQRPFCKHVLALLQLWASASQEFVPVDEFEHNLAMLPGPVVASYLADAAMDGLNPLERLRTAARPPEWTAAPPGRCLEEWEAFRTWAATAGLWPEAALALGIRIAGRPDGSPTDHGVTAAIASRQLAWWLTRMIGVLPPAGLLPWLRHLFRRLDAAATSADALALAPELGVWLARVAVALPEERSCERRWLARFAVVTPTLAPVFEAEARRLLWSAEVSLRLAVAPAVPNSAGGGAVSGRCRTVLDAFQKEHAKEHAEPADTARRRRVSVPPRGKAD